MLENISQTVQAELNKEPHLFKYNVFTLKHAEELHALYKSYEGCAEFLYIPSLQEIKEHIQQGTGCYLGAQTKDGQIVSVCKIDQLQIPSPFFTPPKYEKACSGHFVGLSGILVSKAYRKHGIAKTMISKALNALFKIGASGVYADCDYRNIPSFTTLSSFFNFIGYTDGRMGAEGEKTLYTTFYLSFGNAQKKDVPRVLLDMSNTKNLEDVCGVLNAQMRKIGTVSSQRIAYGNGYNELHVLDERVQTPQITLTLEKAKPVLLSKHYSVATPLTRKNERQKE